MKPLKRFAKLYDFPDTQVLFTIENCPQVKASSFQIHSRITFMSDRKLNHRVSAHSFRNKEEMFLAFDLMNKDTAAQLREQILNTSINAFRNIKADETNVGPSWN